MRAPSRSAVRCSPDVRKSLTLTKAPQPPVDDQRRAFLARDALLHTSPKLGKGTTSADQRLTQFGYCNTSDPSA